VLPVVLWGMAAVAAMSAVYVYRRSWEHTRVRKKDRPAFGTQLVAFAMLGMMSLRFAALLHRGTMLTVPIAVVAISAIVLVSYSPLLNAD
jgi:tellurite resistance protein TehA-like permease